MAARRNRRRTPTPAATKGRAQQAASKPLPVAEPAGFLKAWIAPIAVGIAALAVYVATLAPTVPTGDSGELITASYIGGVAHPPGYPLFTMIGWVATHLWPGSPAVIMNFLSALFQAAAVGLIAVLTARLVDPGWPRGKDRSTAAVAGLAAGAALAVSTAFWAYALVAEVFALNDLFAAALLLLAIEWYRDRTKVWALWTVGLVSGLGAAHQQTIVFLGPALAVLLIAGVREDASAGRAKRRRDRRQRAVKTSHFVVGFAFIGVGLLAYLYLPIAASADPAVNFGDPETVDRFTNVVSRGPYGSFSLIPGGERGSVAENLGLYLSYLLRAFTPLGLLLAAIGSVRMWRAARTESIALLLAFLLAGPSFVIFASAPLDSALTEGIVERFFILSSLPLSVALGAGVFSIVVWLRGRLGDRVRHIALISGAVVLALIGTLAGFRWQSVDQSSNRVAEQYGRDVLRGLEPDAMLIIRGDHNFTSLAFAQHVEGLRPDVAVMDGELLKLGSYVVELRQRYPAIEIPFDFYQEGTNSFVDLVEANLEDRAVYVAGPMPEEVGDELDEVRAGLVRRLAPGGSTDEYGMLLANPDIVTGLRFLDRRYPDTTWEALILREYGSAAHSLGFAFHEPEPTENDDLVVEMYRLAVDLGGPPEAFKNLGLFYWERDGDPNEIIDLWETYLAFEPDDPQVDAIRAAIGQLGG